MTEFRDPPGYTHLGYGKVKTCERCGARVDVKLIETHDAWHERLDPPTAEPASEDPDDERLAIRDAWRELPEADR